VVSDPTEAAYARADRRLRDQLGRMDLDALLEEHRQLPYGPHSDALARLLTYFRRAETSGKHVIYSEGDAGGWRIGRLTHRGDEPRIDLDTETVYPSSALAQQAVLEARVKTLRDGAGDAP
jgi:branched-chain amino acid transport system permease protein